MTHSRRIFLQNAAVMGAGAYFLGGCTSSSPPPKHGATTGKVQGAELITDEAALPTTFNEAPEFKALVKQGKLPPVAERVGKSPLVLKPFQGIGHYGGQIRRGFSGNVDTLNAIRFCSGPDTLLYWDYTYEQVVPNIARAFELSDNDRVLTLHLREGMKWSDGKPFTADDIIFWREDMSLNPALTSGSDGLRINGKEIRIRKVDDLTVQYVSPAPNSLLPQRLASYNDIAGMVAWSYLGGGGMLPKHYLSQFHPKYTSEAAADKLATEAGFHSWAPHFKDKAAWHLNPELPVLTPWVVTRPINDPPWEFAANPYSIWVDNEGNQLPYIPKITMAAVENIEVLGLRAAGGDYDFQDRGLGVTNLPVLLKNQKRGDFTVHRANTNEMEVGVKFNLSYAKDPELGDLIRNVDFRRALSLGIDRRQINESFYLGSSKPSAVMASDDSPYFPGPEWRTKWATHDVKKANALLDKIGLTKKDAQGYRLRRDGKGRIRLEHTSVASFVDFPGIAEMVKSHWRPLGIDVNLEQSEGNLINQEAAANQMMLAVHTVGTADPFLASDNFLPTNTINFGGMIGIEYSKWFASGGRKGTEPPKELESLKEAMKLYRKGQTASEEERVRIGRQLYQLHADQVWSIGILGFGISYYGVYLANNKLRNVPETIHNYVSVRSPANAYPMAFYYE